MPKLALRFISGKYKGGEYLLKEGKEVVVGRSSELDIVLMEDMVSRRHAVLVQRGDKIHVEDRGSTNGTFVNGEKISAAIVGKGDRVLIGTSIMKVVDASDDAAAVVGMATAERRPRYQDMGRTTMHSGARSMTGTIAEVPLPDLIQLFSTSKKTGTLVVMQGKVIARIHLDQGKIVHASLSDAPGLQSMKAITRVLSWDDGTFELVGPEPHATAELLSLPTEHILMEGLRQLDEMRHKQAKLPPPQTRIDVVRPLEARLSELSPAELDVFQLALAAPITVQGVFDRAAVNDNEAAAILDKLLKKKYLTAESAKEARPPPAGRSNVSYGTAIRAIHGGMSRPAQLAVLAAALSVALIAPRAFAQAEAKAPVFTPPQLLEYVKADYPPEAFAQGLEAAVPARLDVDENGLVTAVEILEPAGHGFDEAARDAMLQFVFSPAEQDGVPIPSRVDYRYTFFIERVAPPPAEAKPPAATLAGVVSDMSGLPIPGASIVLTPLGAALPDEAAGADAGAGPEGVEPATADAKGAFSFAEIPPGGYQVDVVASGYRPLAATEELEDGETREVAYRLEREAALYETVVRGRRPPREVTRREITRREITRIPGTGGDALRSVQNLPGMARASFIGGALIVRGSAPGDTDVYFDEMPAPLLYHFGGLTSVINSDLLERIDFYPGNYSARYGGATGGVIDVYPRAPKTDRLHASIDADIWDASALVETPIGEKWSAAASFRRSYIDAILGAVLPDDGGFQFTMAPRYYDYQLIVDYHPSEKDNLRLFVFGSDDKMVFLFGEDMVGNPNFSGDMGMQLSFHQLQLRYDHKFSKAISNHVNIGVGLWLQDFAAGGMYELEMTQVPIFLRDEVALDLGPWFGLRTGVDAEVGWARWKVITPMLMPTEGEQMDPITANDEVLATDGKQWYYRPAWYAELEMKAIEDLRLIYGLRIEYYAIVQKVAIDPRFVARYEIVDGTTLKGGIGMFHQPPGVDQTEADWGNPDLDLIDAVHYSLGAEQILPRPLENLEISLEGFFKQMSRLVVSSDELVERDGEMVTERYNNDGRGKVYGLELMIKHNDNGRFFGWIAYTLMKSSRVDHPGEAARLFDYDQTHILTVVASAVLGRGWEAGVRFRLVSGNPQTPVTGSIYDADSDIYWPIYGRTNSVRMPMFHQLDLRIDKNWSFKYVKFGVYVDVQNVYNHKNVEGINYSYDYRQKAYLVGLPLLPSLGLKLEY